MKRPTRVCECGCGSLTWGRFARGHRLTANVLPPENTIPENVIPENVVAPGPPPGPIDHRLWRIAAERAKIPNPSPVWIQTTCHNCRTRMWTKDPLSTWENGGICEECQYALVSEFHDKSQQQFRRHQGTFRDPFPR